MSRPAPTAARQARERRLEVARALERHGLSPGPRRERTGGLRPPDSEVAVASLREALFELGPVFTDFGRYLSLRADLMRSTDCLLLDGMGLPAAPAPPGWVDARLAEEFGRPRSAVFSAFEQVPFRTGWLDQSHRARLKGGERVVVRLLRTVIDDEMRGELEALDVLGAVLSRPGFSTREHFESVVGDYRAALAARLDLAVEAKDLQALGRDARLGHLLVVPQVYRDLSSHRVLTVQWLPGSTLDQIAAEPLQEVDAQDVARRIGLIWLQMALVGHRFPITADLMELPDGRLAVTGGRFASLPDGSRVRLWNYLRATMEHYPDRATAQLRHEVVMQAPDAVVGELMTRVRQAVPFRDGAWSKTGESLGEYALLHWRLLREVGFEARPHLDDFYQGLFWTARTARRFAPDSDPLGEALRDFDWLAGWNQLRQLTSPQQLGMTAESYLTGLVELPQKIDRILSLATEEGGFRVSKARPRARRKENATATVVSLCLMMVTLVLLQQPIATLSASVGFAAVWAERASAAAFVVLGLLLLRAVRSSR